MAYSNIFGGPPILVAGSGITIANGTTNNSITIGDAYTDISISLNTTPQELKEDDVLTMTIFEFIKWELRDEDFLEYMENPKKIVIMSSSSTGAYKNVSFLSACKKYKPELYEKYRLLIES